MGQEPLRNVRKEIALEMLAEWVHDLLRSHPGEIHLPCGHCLRQSVLDLPRPGRVLDPFCGSARTGVESLRLGLDFTGIDLSPEYCELSRKLLVAENPLFSGLS